MIFKAKHTVNKISKLYAHTKAANKKNLYSSTVLLPQTKIPMRLEGAKLTERDTFINKLPAFTTLYDWQRVHCKEPEFILHDGPPYANGASHMGHAMNKILKDTILRSKILRGQKVAYVPGWDCHGLPIELKTISNKSEKLTPLTIRSRARNFAKQAIENQKQAFQSWGVLGDWDNCYFTYSNAFVKNQMTKFYELYEKNLVYRDVKPVYWSPSSKTALAEAELEYNEKHESTSVIVKLKLNCVPQEIISDNDSEVYALIWSTTPWTLPSNQAVCFNTDLMYSIVQPSEKPEYFIVADKLVDSLSKILNEPLNVRKTFPGIMLSNATYFHPFATDKVLPFLPASHAIDTKGTGLVHTAPAHGPDDFLVALKHNLPITNLVDEAGCFTPDAGPNLHGLFVLSNGTQAVLDIMKEKILHSDSYTHSYPYDWRTKQPVIIRSSKQWFIDTNSLKTRAIELLDDVEILPKAYQQIYKNALVTQLKKRPYWCISRQRSWGAPIPVFYEISSGKPIINRDILGHLSRLIDKHGVDYWWSMPLNDLLPERFLLNENISVDNIEKSKDIFDIWFDSGLSWSNVLPSDRSADMYLEGVDQFTGWFQSSLMTSVALLDISPYKAVYVHGFAVDKNGLKMSKSLGNVVDPCEIMSGKKGKKPYGIDTLRWWVVCHASSDSVVQVSINVLQTCADEVQKVRSVLRFAIAALSDYERQPINYNSLLIIDKYMLHLLWNFHKQMLEALQKYEFNRLSAYVINLVTNPISALYYPAVKDRLYCNQSCSPDRRAAQFVLFQIYSIVTRSIAPIVPHLAEELHFHLPQKSAESFFQAPQPCISDDWYNTKLCNLLENVLLPIKKDLHKVSGTDTLDLDVKIRTTNKIICEFKEIQEDLKELSDVLVDIFQVSKVSVIEDDNLENADYVVVTEKSHCYTCIRCRRVFAQVENELCDRCKLVVANLENKATNAV